jgi:hypothetical protein
LASGALTCRVGADRKRHGSPARATADRSSFAALVSTRAARCDSRAQPATATLYFRRGQSIQPNGWRVWPGVILVRTPGCYAIQVDGLKFSSVIVIRVHVLAAWPYY